MKKIGLPAVLFLLMFLPGCRQKTASHALASIDSIDLKRGEIISCGPLDAEFGSANFQTSCSETVKEDFNLAIKLLHSFEYDEAEKAFAKVIDKQPDCAMAYWGVAMSNFHPLWTPPTEAELVKGAKAAEIATSLASDKREKDYIAAIASFFKDWDKTDHRTRSLAFEKGMENVFANYGDDKDAAVFYALALNAAADPTDKTFTKQKKAGDILQALYPGQPNHPGIAHIIIHTYDYPELAQQGLDAARKYASIAPSSAHALHMPSHIFTRLGHWDECIASNIASVASAQCYAEAAGIKGHWDEELHGLDYLVYAYLQKGENDSAKMQWDYLKTIREVHPVNFKVAYAFASIPSRFLLENKMWQDAAQLTVTPPNFSWNKYPWQEAIIHFTRAMGSVHTNNLQSANKELNELKRLQNVLTGQKDAYKANQVAIQATTAEAWIQWKSGKQNEALSLMQLAADMEDKTEKHPVTPGEVLPAMELLGDMYMQMNMPDKALAAYEANLQKHPNRLNGLYGAGRAAEKTGKKEKANTYFNQLVQITRVSENNRAEVQYGKKMVKL